MSGARWAAGIIAAAAAVRFWRLGAFSLGFDEAMSLAWASGDSLRSVWGISPARAPLYNGAYNSLLHFWMQLGSSPAAIRMPSVALSVVALWLGWRILSRLFPPGPALAALALFAFSPFQVQYAQEARPYMLVLVFEFAATLALLRAVESGDLRQWAAWAGCGAAASLSNLLALTWVAASAVYVLALPGSRRRIGPLAGFGTAAAAPALAFAVAEARTIDWAKEVMPRSFGVFEYLLGVDQFFGPGAWVPASLVMPALAGFALLAVSGVLLAVAPSGARPHGQQEFRAAMLGFGLTPLLLILTCNWAGVLYPPKPRYAMASQLFLLAACARAIWALRRPAARGAVLAGLLALDAASLARYFGGGIPTLDLPPCQKAFHEVAADLVGRARPGDGVLSVEFQTYLPLDWYLGGRLPHAYAARDASFSDAALRRLGFPTDVATFLRAHRRVWCVVAPADYSTPPRMPEDVGARLRRVAVLREETLRPGISIQRWEARRREAP